MNNEEIEKKYRTYIKGAQGTVGFALIMTMVYIIRAAVARNLNFWFCMYTVEFIMRSSDIFSSAVQIVLIIAFIAVFAVSTALSQKKGAWLYVCLGLYAFDTAFLIYGDVSCRFGAFVETQWIDIIVHAFVLVFIAAGIAGARSLNKMGLEYGPLRY